MDSYPFFCNSLEISSKTKQIEQLENKLKEFEKVGLLITKVIKGLSENPNDNSKVEEEVRNEVISLCSSFPIYKNLNK